MKPVNANVSEISLFINSKRSFTPFSPPQAKAQRIGRPKNTYK